VWHTICVVKDTTKGDNQNLKWQIKINLIKQRHSREEKIILNRLTVRHHLIKKATIAQILRVAVIRHRVAILQKNRPVTVVAVQKTKVTDD